MPHCVKAASAHGRFGAGRGKAGGGKCRLPQDSSVSVGFQSDAFFSGSQTKPEREQNEPSHCKTEPGPVQNENPGALAGATGAEQSFKAGELRSDTYRQRDLDATSFADRHRRAARTILYSLTLDGEARNPWHGCAFVLHARLTKVERIGLAFAALFALDPDLRERVFEAAHWGEVTGAGVPLPPFLNVMDDARWWADLANRSERKAYALAAFEALAPADQAAFLRHVQHGRKEPVA
ncbi:hypothetical protein [Albidovulum sp.]|uniref:hypothetical protein n=1 Tax=Albidovulum sp. TaxID=1872424 RepID=UPI001D29AD7F|nr:hypothetical protein [Paracoccaceae bacterium]